MFFVHTTPEKFENATMTGHIGFVFDETLARKSRDYRDVIVLKNSLFKMFSVHTEMQSGRFRNAPFSVGLALYI